MFFFFFSSRRRHTIFKCDWSSDVCSSDLWREPDTDAAGGVHIRIWPFDPRIIDIKFFDCTGLDNSKNTERKIENLYFREDFRRVYLDDIGTIAYAPSVNERYVSAFLKAIDVEGMRKRKYRLVVDYGHGGSVEVLSPIFNAIGADVIALNATRDPDRYSRTAEQFDRDMHVLSSITGTLKADLGVRIDTGGEKIFVVDDRGQLLDGGKLLAAITELVLRGRGSGNVAVPGTAPRVVETVWDRTHCQGDYTRGLRPARTTTATAPRMVPAGDRAGGLVLPEVKPAFDGMFA